MSSGTTAVSHYFHYWARAGYAARGTVYVIVGGLASLAAIGSGGGTTDSHGALQTLLAAPFGSVLLVLVAAGLLGYAVWRTIQTFRDPDGHGTDFKGLAIRTGLGISAVMHLLLASFALNLVVAFGSSGDGGSSSLAGWLMAKPFGRILVMCCGGAIIGAGIAHAVKGWTARFERYLQMPPNVRPWAQPVCRFGLVVRGLALMVIGGLFIAAGYYYDPSAAGGLQAMFDTVRSQPFGTLLFSVIAIGLFAFGIYGFIEAMYRRIDV